ncbi:actin-binding protein WASF3 isoform X2 [Anolis carolinensis]|uniref:Wiskott-Aldrich syndrome protein family member n=1 Tax=Anolis carolinensis TaxID=28377 RepID=A0A803U143_ANOCA|nr:PREDICTED: wiskott-Aldrich syndrome protein family member 3 isoform X2 [Anolis carolinensis]|eukprot:XP_008116086.1 PREDICTED: wiskott-Aldrich syndrome protein family member 3 isoform X2 [Anolis carolinensis]
MPLVKRNIEPRHLCRGALPEGITSELECVTNGTLAAIIRQLSSLSKHAEDIFGELFNEANNFYIRANSLQDRIDRLAVKVTQLDSTVEEVSLQDINMKKAFKSSTIQDQQVVSKNSIPNPIADIYNRSDKPPPLNILTSYRDDKKDGLKFYTDPSYFFDLWKEKMLQDTEDKRKEKRRQKREREKLNPARHQQINVRKVRTRREEWERRKMGIEFISDIKKQEQAESTKEAKITKGSHASDITSYSYPATPNHSIHQQPMMPSYGTGDGLEHEYRPPSTTMRHATLNRPQQPPPPPPQALDGSLGTVALVPADYGMLAAQMVDYYNPSGPPPPPPPPMIPSAQTAFVSPLQIPVLPSHPGLVTGSMYSALHPPSTGLVVTAPPPPGPPPPPPGPPAAGSSLSSPMHAPAVAEAKRHEHSQSPINDARSDLLAAIRMGIQLKKVQEQREQEAKREPVGNDVATILSRRIAVEYSDSDDESECDENDWSD